MLYLLDTSYFPHCLPANKNSCTIYIYITRGFGSDTLTRYHAILWIPIVKVQYAAVVGSIIIRTNGSVLIVSKGYGKNHFNWTSGFSKRYPLLNSG